MDNDSTRNDARLSLVERARRGLLGDALELHEVMTLEFPTAKSYEDRQQPRYKGWQSAIEAAIEFGFLVPRKEPTTVVVPQIVSTRRFYRGALDGAPPPILQKGGSYISTRYWIDRKSYQAWRISQSNPPTGSFVHLWLGATPGPEPAASILPESIPAESLEPAGIALVEAENAALVALRKRLKREPDFEEFWHYLTTEDETGTVADFTDDRVDWVGKSGKACSTSKSTFRNRLTAAKKRNPFTPV